MEITPDTTAEEASNIAVHKAKSAQQAVEMAREIQNADIVDETVRRTKDALLEGLKEVFGEKKSSDPQQMWLIMQQVPILCIQIKQMHIDIGDIKDNLKWAVRIVIGAVIVAILKLVLLP